MSNKPVLYLLPGLGADHRIFTGYAFTNYEKVYLDWLIPKTFESFESYAKRLASSIDTSQPYVLIGVSMGGIVAMEMSKFLKPEAVVLISSIKNQAELPWYFKVFRVLQLYWLIPMFLLQVLPFLLKQREGGRFSRQASLIKEMLKSTSSKFFRRALHWAVFWKNDHQPKNLYHIHGLKDRLFPARYIKGFIPVERGSHFMVLPNHKEIEQKVLEALEEVESRNS